MREIDLKSADKKLPINNFLIYGDTRSGKTTFLASFPRVLIFADATEKGWESLIELPDEQLFEPGVKPMVWAIESMSDFSQALAKAKPLIASGRVKTLGIDSITFYADMYLAGLIFAQTKKDNRSAYGDLGTHLRHIRVETHGQGCNSVWLALAKHPDEDNPTGGPMIPGQQAAKLAASTDYIFYARAERTRVGNKDGPTTFELRTKRFGPYVAGNRLGGRAELPDPMIGTYSDFLTCLGYDANALRKTLPPIGAPLKINMSAPIKPVVPPVIVTRPVVNQPAPSRAKI